MKLLFIGDICGRPGREFLGKSLAKIQWEKNIDFTIVNGENASAGRGLGKKSFNYISDLGVDCITLGNHMWDNKEVLPLLKNEEKLIRPANLEGEVPGNGYRIFSCKDNGVEKKIAVVNLIGQVEMNLNGISSPFEKADEILAEIGDKADYIFVDFHAETTSEKKAMGYYLNGRISGIVGTHTHVQTNDARILDKGTAYLTDAGMTGILDSCLGMAKEPVIQRFLTGTSERFYVPDGEAMLNGCIITLSDKMKATNIELVNIREFE